MENSKPAVTIDYPRECKNPWSRVRILWSSNKDDPTDYYADKLELLRNGDDEYALQFSMSGEVMIRKIKNLGKYL